MKVYNESSRYWDVGREREWTPTELDAYMFPGQVAFEPVCRVKKHANGERNKRLILSADLLLQTCKAVAETLKTTDLGGHVIWVNPPFVHRGVHMTAWEALDAAIAAAEGEEVPQ